MSNTTHSYKGYEILPWSGPYQQGRKEPRWYIQTYHAATGIPWSAENCPQAYTLTHAREKINEMGAAQ